MHWNVNERREWERLKQSKKDEKEEKERERIKGRVTRCTNESSAKQQMRLVSTTKTNRFVSHETFIQPTKSRDSLSTRHFEIKLTVEKSSELEYRSWIVEHLDESHRTKTRGRREPITMVLTYGEIYFWIIIYFMLSRYSRRIGWLCVG